MANERLKHDCAWSAAAAIVELFTPLLRQEEVNEAFGQGYTACRALLDIYETQLDREAARLCKPSSN